MRKSLYHWRGTHLDDLFDGLRTNVADITFLLNGAILGVAIRLLCAHIEEAIDGIYLSDISDCYNIL